MRSVVGLPGPRVLANSAPKAGTHLLISLLRRMPKLLNSGRHHSLNEFRAIDERALSAGAEFRWDDVAQAYGKVRAGQFATGHFPAHPEFLRVLRELDLRTVVIFRDPRDMVVSNAFYIRSLERHPLHAAFSSFTTVGEAIAAAITGLDVADGGRYPSIAERMSAHIPWLDAPDVLTVRFEDLVGQAGGGSQSAQREAVARIARHVDRPLADEQLDRLCDSVFSQGSATFRKGQIGDWRNHFTDTQVELFKERAGDQLVRLGYETDDGW